MILSREIAGSVCVLMNVIWSSIAARWIAGSWVRGYVGVPVPMASVACGWRIAQLAQILIQPAPLCLRKSVLPAVRTSCAPPGLPVPDWPKTCMRLKVCKFDSSLRRSERQIVGVAVVPVGGRRRDASRRQRGIEAPLRLWVVERIAARVQPVGKEGLARRQRRVLERTAGT